MLLKIKQWFIFATKSIVQILCYFCFVFMSILISTAVVFNYDEQFHMMIYDITDTDFLIVLLEIFICLIVVFIISIIINILFLKHSNNELVYTCIDFTFAFFILILFAFILSINNILNDYLDLLIQMKAPSSLSYLDIQKAAFIMKSSINLFICFLISCIVAFQTTFKFCRKITR